VAVDAPHYDLTVAGAVPDFRRLPNSRTEARTLSCDDRPDACFMKIYLRPKHSWKRQQRIFPEGEGKKADIYILTVCLKFTQYAVALVPATRLAGEKGSW
jgi:hypothetical protein